MKFQVLFLLSLILLSISGCKSKKMPTVLTRDMNVQDTVIRHEVESITLPQRNYIVIENPCKEDELSIADQVITNERSSVEVKEEDGHLAVRVNIDSIVSSRLSEISNKTSVERIEIPVEVEVPVKNKLNLYLLGWAVLATGWIFKGPLLAFAKKLINPLA
jgi:hypothetical protein